MAFSFALLSFFDYSPKCQLYTKHYVGDHIKRCFNEELISTGVCGITLPLIRTSSGFTSEMHAMVYCPNGYICAEENEKLLGQRLWEAVSSTPISVSEVAIVERLPRVWDKPKTAFVMLAELKIEFIMDQRRSEEPTEWGDLKELDNGAERSMLIDEVVELKVKLGNSGAALLLVLVRSPDNDRGTAGSMSHAVENSNSVPKHVSLAWYMELRFPVDTEWRDGVKSLVEEWSLPKMELFGYNWQYVGQDDDVKRSSWIEVGILIRAVVPIQHPVLNSGHAIGAEVKGGVIEYVSIWNSNAEWEPWETTHEKKLYSGFEKNKNYEENGCASHYWGSWGTSLLFIFCMEHKIHWKSWKALEEEFEFDVRQSS